MVMWALAELGLAYERIDVGGAFGGIDAPEFRAMYPNGLVPVVEIDGLVFGRARPSCAISARAWQRGLLAGEPCPPCAGR